jgi:glycosyltransferase involved in cell wall biosynthesis
MPACRIGFIMEQTLGHATYHRDLERWAGCDPSILPTWFPIPSWRADRWARTPVVRTNLSLALSLRARDEIRTGPAGSRFDALFFHTQATALCSLGLSRRLPVVISLDATPKNIDSMGAGYRHRPDNPGPAGLLKWSYYRRLFRRAAVLTTWNQWARDSLVRDYRVAPEKVAVIPPGVDLDSWRVGRAAVDAPGPARLLFVGGDFARKGGDVLLDAFRAGLSGRSELDIVTGPDGPEGGPAVRVHRGLTPADPAMRRLFQRADLFVLPTLADCSPLAITEAMASGLPVVATDVGAIAEQVVHGETGLLVPPGDPAALGRAVASLLDDPGRLRAFGAAGRLRAERLFDGQRNYRALIGLLKRCVPGPAPRAGRRPDPTRADAIGR